MLDDANDHGTFNLKEGTILFNGKSYKYDQEKMRSDEFSISEAIKQINQDENENYPQGIPYCEFLLNSQLQTKGIIIQLSIDKKSFFFPLTKFNELEPDRGFRLNKKRLYNNYMFLITFTETDYQNDFYPQGFDCFNSIFKLKWDNNDFLYILTRKVANNRWVRYFFDFDQYDKFYSWTFEGIENKIDYCEECWIKDDIKNAIDDFEYYSEDFLSKKFVCYPQGDQIRKILNDIEKKWRNTSQT